MKQIIEWALASLIKLFYYAKAKPKLTSILLLVFVWHIALFQLFGIKLPKLSKIVAPPKSISIQTVKLNPPQEKAPAPKPKPPTPKPKEPEKAPKPKPPEKPKEEVSKATKKLLDDLSKTLDSITKRNEEELHLPKIKTITPLSAPVKDQAPSSSFEFNLADPADLWYREELIKRLKLYLKLPEIEAVQIRLTINKSGIVSDIKIVESKSDKNQEYVLQAIPKIPFPKFGSQMSKHEFRIFPLILESEG